MIDSCTLLDLAHAIQRTNKEKDNTDIKSSGEELRWHSFGGEVKVACLGGDLCRHLSKVGDKAEGTLLQPPGAGWKNCV